MHIPSLMSSHSKMAWFMELWLRTTMANFIKVQSLKHILDFLLKMPCQKTPWSVMHWFLKEPMWSFIKNYFWYRHYSLSTWWALWCRLCHIFTYMTLMHSISKGNLKNMKIQILMSSHSKMAWSMGLWLRTTMANLIKVQSLNNILNFL